MAEPSGESGNVGPDQIVEFVKQRLRTRGIDLDKYVGTIKATWPTPPGFKFDYKSYTDPTSRGELLTELRLSSGFAQEGAVGGALHEGFQFREVSQDGSLHVILAAIEGQIHFDRISVCLARRSDGGIIYNMENTSQHFATDVLRLPAGVTLKPEVTPQGEGRIMLGVRF
jgi:hypothetical protein